MTIGSDSYSFTTGSGNFESSVISPTIHNVGHIHNNAKFVCIAAHLIVDVRWLLPDKRGTIRHTHAAKNAMLPE